MSSTDSSFARFVRLVHSLPHACLSDDVKSWSVVVHFSSSNMSGLQMTERQQLAIALRESMTAAPAKFATPSSAPRPHAHSPSAEEVRKGLTPYGCELFQT